MFINIRIKFFSVPHIAFKQSPLEILKDLFWLQISKLGSFHLSISSGAIFS